MGSLTSVSQAQLARRRRALRLSRRRKFCQTAWQILTISCLTGGTIWAITRPDWFIYQPSDAIVSGNQVLSTPAIQSLLPISYPISLLELRPEEIEQKLESMAPISQAIVTRKLFPPELIVEVQEKYPVAIAQVPSSASPAELSPHSKNTSIADLGINSQLGLLDENGVWMSQDRYISLDRFIHLPSLVVIGDPKQYRPYWSQLYQAIDRSAIEVYEIDWRDPSNLILKTELGIVHCGGQIAKVTQQLRVLEQMLNLSTQVNPTQIDYIDLTNPQKPTIQKTP